MASYKSTWFTTNAGLQNQFAELLSLLPSPFTSCLRLGMARLKYISIIVLTCTSKGHLVVAKKTSAERPDTPRATLSTQPRTTAFNRPRGHESAYIYAYALTALQFDFLPAAPRPQCYNIAHASRRLLLSYPVNHSQTFVVV